MVKRTRPCLGALAVVAALASAAPAAPAQGDAPQVDPDSPAGTEYQLPLDRAREEAGAGRGGGTGGGTGGSSGGSAGEAPLFGEGVEPNSTPQPSQPRGGSASASDPATTAKAEFSDAAPAATPETLRAQAPSPDGGGSELVAVGAGAGGVLLLGGLAGLLLRRRSMAG